MKKILLTQGKFALVDDADFEWINQWKWSLLQGKYAHRNLGNGKWLRMHRLIVNTPTGMSTDHINGNGLDNRRSNLRICTQQQNTLNSVKKKNNSSGYKNIWWDKSRMKWCVQIMHKGRKYSPGRFNDLETAVFIRDKHLQELHGEFANVL